MPNMPIDWTSVDWVNVGLLSAIAFIAALISNILIFKHRFWAAILAGLLFAAVYVFLAYYPHERPVPVLKTGGRGAASPGLALTSLPPDATCASGAPLARPTARSCVGALKERTTIVGEFSKLVAFKLGG